MIRRPPRSTLSSSSAASDVYKRQVPSNNLPRICICYQIQITKSFHRLNISYIANPQLMSFFWHKVFYQIWIFMHPMITVSCPNPITSVSYTHLRAHETRHDLVCRLLLEKKKKN